MNQTLIGPKPTDKVKSLSKYLAFKLGDETYGLEILTVQEIIGMMPITRVPQTARFIRGVVNLRGRVVPVIDLRLKLGLDPAPDSKRTCIVVTEIADDGEQMTAGLTVDEVSDVVDIDRGQITESPDFGGAAATPVIDGMARIGDTIIILLNGREILANGEIQRIAQISETAAPRSIA